MNKRDALAEATSRLDTALEAFENLAARQRQASLTVEALEEQVQTLTSGLEAERARSDRLEAANDTVSERLEAMIDRLTSIMQSG